MKTSFLRKGKFKLVLFLTLCAVVLGCTALLCINASSQNINSAGAPEPTEQTEIFAPDREVKTTATSVAIPSINASDKYTINGSMAVAEYTGSAIQMTVGTNFNPTYMTPSEGAYTPYITGTNPGSYIVTMTLKSGYQWSDGTTGAKTYTLIIYRKVDVSISGNYDSGSGTSATAKYTGSGITLAYDGPWLSGMSASGDNSGSYPYITETNAGTYTMSISLPNITYYKWSDGTSSAKTFTLTITKVSVAIPTLAVSSGSPTISGRTATATCNGSEFAVAIDGFNSSTMSISPANGIISGTTAGTYSRTVSLRDTTNYQWSDGTISAKTYSLVLTGKAVSSLTFGSIATQTYSNSAKTPTFTVKDGSTTLTNGTHYTLTYKNNVNVGTATVTVTGKGNYGGSVDRTFTISARNISNANFGTIGTQTYNFGAELKPTPTITDSGISKTLTNNTDFTFSYSNNTAVGSATIKITGKGNYTGTKSTTFAISARSLSGATIGTISAQTYDGTEKKPTATVTYGSTTLSSTNDFTFSWSNNINAGTATLTITGKGNYSGTKTANFTINARSISLASVAAIASQGYTGSAKTPLPTLTDLSKTLANNTDYTLSYQNNTNVGTATVTITGKGNYTGTKTATFTITARSITNASVGTIEKFYYDGAEKTPTPAITDGGKTLVAGTDFSYGYRNNTAVGTATLIITGLGNYTGTKEVSFVIEAPTIANATVTISQTAFTYDGTAKEPSVSLVQIADLTLVEGVDFTVSYSANINAGTGKVILTGAGDYSGTKEVEFTISPADMSGATVSGLQLTYTYTGSAIEPVVSIILGGKTLERNVDYLIEFIDNLNVGAASFTVTGSRNYTGTLTDGFTIVRADISSATVTGVNATYEYTGGDIEPLPKVNWNGILLVKDTDYTLSFADNTALGKATITVAGFGNFNGSFTVDFDIVRADISGATVTGIDATYEYKGSAIVPNVTVTYNGVALVLGTDFEVTLADNVDKGTATVTIEGVNNYAGTITRNFVIGSADIDGAEVTGIDAEYEYTGKEIVPEPTVTFNGIVLTAGVDYSVAYADNKELGTATVTITGLGNFDAVKEVKFEVVAASIASAEIAGVEENYSYTGSVIEPEPTVTLNGVVLEKGVDYTVTYRNNKEVSNGTAAIVVVTGIGNYTGVKETAFTIGKADLSDAEVTGIAIAYQWTGAALTPRATVKLNGVLLLEAIDYTLSFGMNVEVGTATYIITGINNYVGGITGTFAITKAMPKPEISFEDWNGTDTLFAGKSLPKIAATAYYNNGTVSGTIAWKEVDGVAPTLKAGTDVEYDWIFTPDDTDHYFEAVGTVRLTAVVPTYVAIRAEWKDGVQPELFTSSSITKILQGLKVTGIFNNGATDEIEGGFTFVGDWDTSGAVATLKMPTAGKDDWHITVWFAGFSYLLPVDVVIKDVVLTGITVDDNNAVKDYTALDKFDASSIVVTATYNDGNEKVLALGKGGYSLTYEKGAEYLQYGETKVTVTFTDGGVPKTGEVTGLTVAKKEFEGTLALNPEDKDYNFGSTLTGEVIENLPDWVTVTYIYEDEEGNTYTGGVTNAGTYKVTAKFEVDDNHEAIADITATFTINKIDPVLTPAVGGSLTAGMKLSDLTFSSGNGATAGTLTWDDAAYELKEGINRCYYTFTPDDKVNFKTYRGYVDIAAEAQPIAPTADGGNSLGGWQIALIVICAAIALAAVVALIIALKLRGNGDPDGFNDPVTEDDLKF